MCLNSLRLSLQLFLKWVTDILHLACLLTPWSLAPFSKQNKTLYDFTKGTSNDYGSSLSFGGAGLLGLSTNFGLQDISRSVSLTRFSKSDIGQVIKLPAEMTDACFNKPITTSFSYWSAQSIILPFKQRRQWQQQQRHFVLLQKRTFTNIGE